MNRSTTGKECDRAVKASMEAEQKEKEAKALVSGLRADVKALQNQVTKNSSSTYLYQLSFTSKYTR